MNGLPCGGLTRASAIVVPGRLAAVSTAQQSSTSSVALSEGLRRPVNTAMVCCGVPRDPGEAAGRLPGPALVTGKARGGRRRRHAHGNCWRCWWPSLVNDAAAVRVNGLYARQMVCLCVVENESACWRPAVTNVQKRDTLFSQNGHTNWHRLGVCGRASMLTPTCWFPANTSSIIASGLCLRGATVAAERRQWQQARATH